MNIRNAGRKMSTLRACRNGQTYQLFELSDATYGWQVYSFQAMYDLVKLYAHHRLAELVNKLQMTTAKMNVEILPSKTVEWRQAVDCVEFTLSIELTVLDTEPNRHWVVSVNYQYRTVSGAAPFDELAQALFELMDQTVRKEIKRVQ